MELIDSSDRVCSLASKRRRYRQEVDVNSTQSLPFVIRPLNAGFHEVEVKISVKGFYAGDGIIRKLHVMVSIIAL